ncbi:LMBR1 domain-containing protein 2 homolog A-like [Camellia sinensis]|uniref:LMBR1 domain-containing protein 2 homolog A-like n=1 Tax=Camellia sinensis TaxID=4442 RepID=UPI0010366814|nr:LMBR1 domain-containing protein 2 homolog A-like [Camellia sinensis]
MTKFFFSLFLNGQKFSNSAAYCSCATAYSSCAFLCHCFVFISLDALVVRVHFSSFIVKDGHILIVLYEIISLSRAVVPIIQGYEDAGDFTVAERLKTSVHVNLVFYLCVGSIGLFGLILLIILRKYRNVTILGFAMACSNTFGLVTGAFLLGFGLSEIPKGIWKNVDWTFRQKVLSQKVAKMAVKLDDAHQEFSNAIVVAQATSKQMSKRDPLRPYMNVIDNMLLQMFSEDPSFKPQGGRFGENDMDYDTDEKSMAALRLQIKRAREEYYRCKSEYMNFVMEALELEDTIKNYDRRHATGWKFISSFRPERAGALGSFLDMIELVYRCILRKQLEKVLAVILGCMSAAILLAEATILPSGVDLSLFSILINAVGKQEVLVQVAAFIPLMYMCVCTYYSLFKIGMLTFYSFTPRQTSSVSLLMICSMVARYAPPISYNFLNLIRLGEKDEDKKTIFEKRMGNIDQAVPFFGNGFNKIYPLIMVIYTIMIASNFFDRIIDYFGNWKIFRFQSEADDIDDGFDPSGLMILQKERSWLDQGHKVGELVIPLARNFNDINMDLESSSNNKVAVDTKTTTSLIEDGQRDYLILSRGEAHHQTSRESIARKYVAVRAQQSKQPITQNLTEKSRRASFNATFPDAGSSQNTTAGPSSRLSSTWESMKTGLQNLKSNMGAKKFLPLREIQDTKHSLVSSSESLDDIFQRLNQPNMNHRSYGGGDDYDDELDDHSINVRKLRSIG